MSSGGDAAQALEHDLVLGQQVQELVDAGGHLGAELAHLRLPAARDVLDHAADLDVARVHPLAGRHLEQVEDLLAVAEAVPEHRDRAEVERAGAQPDEVGHDPVELHVQHAQVLAAARHLELEQRLDGVAEGHGVEEVRQVVHPLDDRDDLPVGLVLGGLLDAGVDVADHRDDVAHDLALERGEQAQHPMRRGVVRAHVERQQLLLGAVRDVRELVRVLDVAIREVAHWPEYLGKRDSLCVNSTGSPPTGKSRRCGWPS